VFHGKFGNVTTAGGALAASASAVAGAAFSAVAKETLILSLQEFQVPGRTVNKANLEYLNGNSHYPTRPQPLADVTATFRDFTGAPTRAILHQLFQATFDETSGFMLPPSALKTTGHLLLFGSGGTLSRQAKLEGVWLQDEPQTSIAFGRGEILTMAVKFSCDRVIWQPSLWTPSPL